MARKNEKKVVATIALYGTSARGAGYIARAADGRMFGDGEPKEARAMTEALWLAGLELRDAGIGAGLVEVTIDVNGRPLMAVADLGCLPYFGDLSWGPGRV